MALRNNATEIKLSEEQRLAKNKRIAKTIQETRNKRSQMDCKVFTLKIQTNKLNASQREALKMQFVEAKWLRNHIIANGNIAGYQIGKTVQVKNKAGELESREFNHLGSQMRQSVLQQVKNDLRGLVARKTNGGKVGKLKFVSDYKSLDLKQHGNTYRFKSASKLKIQNIPGYLRVSGWKQLEWADELANAKLLNKPDGYYLAVTCYRAKTKQEEGFHADTVVGVDMGVATHLTLSNGVKVNASVQEIERLKRLQRKLSRQVKGSKNHWKTKTLIQREYQKMTNKKDDLANKIVADLLKNEVVCLQDENLAGWRRENGYIRGGKKLHHSVLGRVKAKLVASDRVVVLRKDAATTQTCVCGERRKLHVSERHYFCGACGYSQDRDVHAAQNMVRMVKQSAKKTTLPVGRRLELVERLLDADSKEFALSAAKQEATSYLCSL